MILATTTLARKHGVRLACGLVLLLALALGWHVAVRTHAEAAGVHAAVPQALMLMLMLVVVVVVVVVVVALGALGALVAGRRRRASRCARAATAGPVQDRDGASAASILEAVEHRR